MKRTQLYLETSVWNFYFADDAPEKKEITLRFFEKVKQDIYEIFISDVVIEEIKRAKEKKRQSLLKLITEYNPIRLIMTEDAFKLAKTYISEGILPASKMNDAMHVGIASVFEVDALISWNLKHIANLEKWN